MTKPLAKPSSVYVPFSNSLASTLSTISLLTEPVLPKVICLFHVQTRLQITLRVFVVESSDLCQPVSTPLRVPLHC